MAELSSNRHLIFVLLHVYRFHDNPEDVELSFVTNFIADLPEKVLGDYLAMFEESFLKTGEIDPKNPLKLTKEQIKKGQRLMLANGIKMGEMIFDQKLYKKYFMYNYRYGEPNEEPIETCCTVCLEVFTKDSLLSRLPCCHSFHEKCLAEWLRNNFRNQHRLSCPICRKSLNHNDDGMWSGLDVGPHLRSLC